MTAINTFYGFNTPTGTITKPVARPRTSPRAIFELGRKLQAKRQTRAAITEAFGLFWVDVHGSAANKTTRLMVADFIRAYRASLPGRVTATGQHVNPYDAG